MYEWVHLVGREASGGREASLQLRNANLPTRAGDQPRMGRTWSLLSPRVGRRVQRKLTPASPLAQGPVTAPNQCPSLI